MTSKQIKHFTMMCKVWHCSVVIKIEFSIGSNSAIYPSVILHSQKLKYIASILFDFFDNSIVKIFLHHIIAVGIVIRKILSNYHFIQILNAINTNPYWIANRQVIQYKYWNFAFVSMYKLLNNKRRF